MTEDVDKGVAELDELQDEFRELLRPFGAEFHVTDESSADWVIARITEARDQQERLNEQHKARIAALNRRLKYLDWRFGGELQAYVAANLPHKKKSVRFAHGTAAFRHVAERVVVEDQKAALEAARATCPSAVVTTERLVVTPIFEHFVQTGEVLAGCRHEPARESFSVR